MHTLHYSTYTYIHAYLLAGLRLLEAEGVDLATFEACEACAERIRLSLLAPFPRTVSVCVCVCVCMYVCI
jgi:hypothetical protein